MSLAVPLLLVIFAQTAQAIEPRWVSAGADLFFDQSVVTCVACSEVGALDQLEITITLYQGITYVDSWSGSGTGQLTVSGSCAVQSKKPYTLLTSFYINGVKQTVPSVTKTSP